MPVWFTIGCLALTAGYLYLSDVADNGPAHRAQKFNRLPVER